MNVEQLKQKLILWKLTQAQKEQGLTLTECVVAIVVLSAVIVSMTPPIFLAVATRAQNKKAEQALQLAHGEIDKIRVLVERGEYQEKELPFNAGNVTVNAVSPPQSGYQYLQSTNFTCSKYDNQGAPQLAVTQALPVDVNGDCKPDFLVQTFRVNQVLKPGTNIPMIFRMGVRVYSISAANLDPPGEKIISIKPNLTTKEASLQLTTGEGDQTTRPLSVLTVDIAQADNQSSLTKYCAFLNNGNTCP